MYVEVVKGDNTASYKLTEWNATTTDDKGNETYSNDKRKRRIWNKILLLFERS